MLVGDLDEHLTLPMCDRQGVAAVEGDAANLAHDEHPVVRETAEAVRRVVLGQAAEEPTTIEDVLNHFDHVKKLIGSEHLGVGSNIDLDGYEAYAHRVRGRLVPGVW